MNQRRTLQVVFQPAVRIGMQRGINTLANAIRPTLGPHARAAMVERTIRSYAPSLLDDAGVIARRVIALPDRGADLGAMLLRQMLWQLREEVGDGAATAAVIFQSLFNAGVQQLAAGVDAMLLRRELERVLACVDEYLAAAASPLDGAAQISALAATVCHDEKLAALLGEVFEIIGAEGQLAIQPGRSLVLEREYVAGMYWPAPTLSPTVLLDLPKSTWRGEQVGLVLSDLVIDDPRDLVSLLDRAVAHQFGGLIVVAQQIAEPALRVLLANQTAMPSVVVRTPGTQPHEQLAALEDLAVLCGGHPLLSVAGQRLSMIRDCDFGQANHGWADQHHVGIGGGRNAHALRAQLARLRQGLAAAQPAQRDLLEQRIGRLVGGSVTLRIGGATTSEVAVQQAHAERAARVIRSALRDGVALGGGTLLLDCAAVLRQGMSNAAPLERAALVMVARALEAPFCTILANAGYEVAPQLAHLRRACPGTGFDVRAGKLADMRTAGVIDSVGVVRAATRSAISSAALALTIECVIHSANPTVVTEP